MKSLLQQPRSITEDDTTDTLSFENNLLIDFDEESKAFTVNFNPVDMRNFADASFPKLKNHMSGNATRRKRRNANASEETG